MSPAHAQVYDSTRSMFTHLDKVSWIVVALLVLIAMRTIWIWRVRSRERNDRADLVMGIEGENQDLILLMAGIAKADGSVLQVELRTITNVYRAVTGNDVTKSQVAQVLDAAGPNFERTNFRDLGRSLSSEQRAILLKSLYQVMASDGELHTAEQNYVTAVCDHIGITHATRQSVWMDLVEENPLFQTVKS